MSKRCTKCKKVKEISNFEWDNFHKQYIARCKVCRYLLHKNTLKIYSKSKEGKKNIGKASKKAYINHKEKWLARAKARYAIKIGIIIKPKKCEVCERIKPLQGHHEDYSKPLEVIFLCYSCHAEADKLLLTKSPPHI